MLQPTISASFVQFHKDLVTPLAAADSRGLGIWLYVEDNDGTIPSSVTFGFYFGTSAGDTSGGFATVQANIGGMRNGRWTFVCAQRSAVTYGGGAAATVWNTHKITRVIAQRYGTASEQPFWVGGFELCYPARPKLLLSFDGQYASIRDYVKPLMEARGMVGTMFVSWDVVGGARMSRDDLGDLLVDGWGIGVRKFANNSVGFDDADTYPTANSVADDLIQGMKECLALGASPADASVIAVAQSNPFSLGFSYAIREKVERGYQLAGVKAARLGSPVSTGYGNGVFTNQFHETGVDGHLPLVFTRQLHDTLTSAAALADVDEAIHLGSTMSHYVHQTAAGGSNGVWSEANMLAYLNGVRDRVRKGLIDVMTWGEYVRNLQTTRLI